MEMCFPNYSILCLAHPIVMGLSIMYISILNWQFFPYFSRKWLNFHIRFVMPNVSVTNRMFKDIYCFSFSIIPAKIGKLWNILKYSLKLIAERFSIILHLNDSHCKLNFIQRFSCFSQNSFVHYSQILYRVQV